MQDFNLNLPGFPWPDLASAMAAACPKLKVRPCSRPLMLLIACKLPIPAPSVQHYLQSQACLYSCQHAVPLVAR